MAIIPDEKDLTWVLTTPCLECGYLGTDVDPHAVLRGPVPTAGTGAGCSTTRRRASAIEEAGAVLADGFEEGHQALRSP